MLAHLCSTLAGMSTVTPCMCICMQSTRPVCHHRAPQSLVSTTDCKNPHSHDSFHHGTERMDRKQPAIIDKTTVQTTTATPATPAFNSGAIARYKQVGSSYDVLQHNAFNSLARFSDTPCRHKSRVPARFGELEILDWIRPDSLRGHFFQKNVDVMFSLRQLRIYCIYRIRRRLQV